MRLSYPLHTLQQKVRVHALRRTVRTRLTSLYSAVFMLCGAALLAVTYLLVARSTDDVAYLTRTGTPGNRGTVYQQTFSGSFASHPVRDLPSLSPRLDALASQLQGNDLHQLLTKSGIALAIMTLSAVALGYFVSGRVLRPLRSITVAARGISAANLHERLALKGPDDELKELGDTFDELLRRLEVSFVSQRQFVANASHELRSPLTRLRVLAEVAASDDEATVESMRAALQGVIAASERQEQLLEALLTLAKGQGGIAQPEPIDLATLVRRNLVGRSADLDNLGLLCEMSLGDAPVVGDERLIDRLVANLIENAMRYNVAGGHIRLVTGSDAHSATFEISNDGQTVPPEELHRLFQPFQRLEVGRRHHQTGHGLGLSIVNAITEAHGAVLRARALPGGGLHIHIQFPAVDPCIEDAAEPSADCTRFRSAHA
jgi:signal transduction histidine kinase